MKKKPVHACDALTGEYTLCGLALDEPDHEELDPSDPDNWPAVADPGQSVNCPHCLRVIRWCRKFKRNKAPYDAP